MNDTVSTLLMLIAVVWPLLLGIGVAVPALRRAALPLAPWAALPALVAALLAPATALHLPWLLLGATFGIDDVGRTFLLFTALLWWIAGVYARAYMTDDPARDRFLVYFLLAMCGNLGLIVAQDLLSFYLCFALMSFSSYGLVVHARSGDALRAGRVYIALVVAGELVLFAAMLLAASAAASTQFAAVSAALAHAPDRDLVLALAFVGFGIKAGVIGLHVWLPLAYPVAPTPASAALSGAMINAGLLGWLRLLPLGEITLPGWGAVFITFGLVAVFYGVAIGLAQRDPKTVLAYSSISQMGLMTAGVGIGLAAPGAWPAILVAITLYALHHGLSKGALFLGIGVVSNGDQTQRRRAWCALWLPALALAGAPLTSGIAAKTLLKAQALHAPAPWDTALTALLPWSAVATSLLMARLLWLTFPCIVGNATTHAAVTGIARPWAWLLAFVVTVPVWHGPAAAALSLDGVIDGLWPLLLAGVATALVLRRRRARRTPPDETAPALIPPGDILAPISRVLTSAIGGARKFAVRRLPRLGQAILGALKHGASRADWRRNGARLETVLVRWRTALWMTLLLGTILSVWSGGA